MADTLTLTSYGTKRAGPQSLGVWPPVTSPHKLFIQFQSLSTGTKPPSAAHYDTGRPSNRRGRRRGLCLLQPCGPLLAHSPETAPSVHPMGTAKYTQISDKKGINSLNSSIKLLWLGLP